MKSAIRKLDDTELKGKRIFLKEVRFNYQCFRSKPVVAISDNLPSFGTCRMPSRMVAVEPVRDPAPLVAHVLLVARQGGTLEEGGTEMITTGMATGMATGTATEIATETDTSDFPL